MRYLRVGGRGFTPRAGFCLGVEKCPKMPQNPTRQVHAVLGGFYERHTESPKRTFKHPPR